MSLWKDLGGFTSCFYADGNVHPMQFLRKISRMFDEAGVPEAARVGLALNCLKGSAGEWAGYKESSLSSFEQFKEAFKSRYWGVEEERKLFLELKYGKYRTGSKADYFLKLARQSSFLSDTIAEKDLVEWLAQHFADHEITRGIFIKGLTTVDKVDFFKTD